MKTTIDLGILFLIVILGYTLFYSIIYTIVYLVKKLKFKRKIMQLIKINRRIRLVEEYAEFVALSTSYKSK